MARGNPLGFVCYVDMPDGRTVPLNDLTETERAQMAQNMRQRLSEDMSAFFTQRPQEFAAL